jgi:hypothetical protein
MWSASVWAKNEVKNQANGVLLAHNGGWLWSSRKEVPYVPDTRPFHTSSAKPVAPHNSVLAI